MLRAIVNANVLPMTRPDARATAIAWDDKVLAVGADEEILRLAAEQGLPVEDAEGRTILPGFVDAHMHFLHVGLKRTRPDLRGAASREQALERLATWLAAHPGDDPVTGEGWDESDWPIQEPPHRDDIDAVAGGRPVVLRRICGHVAVANSAALPAIQARWDDPALVDPATGRLLEAPSLYLNEALPASPSQLAAAVDEATRVAHALGVTAIGDYEQAPLRDALLEAARQGRLGVRVACSIYLQHLEQAIAGGFRTGRRHTDMLFDAGLKLFLDGSIGGHTAHLLDPYADGGGTGMANFDDDALDAAMRQAQDAGIQIHAHAIGDGAIEQGLRAFERLAAQQGDGRPAAGLGIPLHGQTLGHRFEHFEIARDEQIARSAALGLWASSQPNFVGEWSAAGGMYEQRIGPRYRLNNRFQAIRAARMRLAFGSDGMPFGPLFGIQCAMQHPDPAQRVGVHEAIWHYTHEAAASLGHPEWGSLAPGRPADLLILEQTDLAAPPTTWVIRETIVAGQAVRRGTAPQPTDDDVVGSWASAGGRPLVDAMGTSPDAVGTTPDAAADR